MQPSDPPKACGAPFSRAGRNLAITAKPTAAVHEFRKRILAPDESVRLLCGILERELQQPYRHPNFPPLNPVRNSAGDTKTIQTPSHRSRLAMGGRTHGQNQNRRFTMDQLPQCCCQRLYGALPAFLLLAIGSLGCSTGSHTPPAEPAPLVRAAKPVSPPLSLNEVMVGFIDHSAHGIWEVGAREPKTKAEWLAVEHQAIQLAAAGPLLTLGGKGKLDADWVKEPDWSGFSQKMTDAAMEAVNGARARNLQAVLTAGDKLVEACEGCHNQFKPDVPTGGITQQMDEMSEGNSVR